VQNQKRRTSRTAEKDNGRQAGRNDPGAQVAVRGKSTAAERQAEHLATQAEAGAAGGRNLNYKRQNKAETQRQRNGRKRQRTRRQAGKTFQAGRENRCSICNETVVGRQQAAVRQAGRTQVAAGRKRQQQAGRQPGNGATAETLKRQNEVAGSRIQNHKPGNLHPGSKTAETQAGRQNGRNAGGGSSSRRRQTQVKTNPKRR